MYYENESQFFIKNQKPAEKIIDEFISDVIILHDNRDHIKLKRLFKIKESIDTNDEKYIIKFIRSNVYVKKTLNVIKDIVSEKIFNTLINNIIKNWVRKLNNSFSDELKLISKQCEFINIHESDKMIRVKIENELWDAFSLRCKRSNLSYADGFKFALVYYVVSEE